MSIPIPRLQGNAYQRDNNSWGWELKISFGDADPLFMSVPDEHKGFETKELAIEDLKKHAMGASDEISKVLGAKPQGYLNLKTNMIEETLS